MGGEKRKAGGFTCKCYEPHENKIRCESVEKIEMDCSIAAKYLIFFPHLLVSSNSSKNRSIQ
jgi:hypothetical protein